MYRFDKLKKIMKREMRIFPIGKREKGKEQYMEQNQKKITGEKI